MAEVQPLRTLRYEPVRRRLARGGDRPAVRRDRRPSCARSCSPRARSTWSRSTCPRRRAAATPTPTRARPSRPGASRGSSCASPSRPSGRLQQDYTAPDGSPQRRRGFFARVRVEDYGPGRIRPHERTHPGPKEDRLALTRATRANLSPIFSLFADPERRRPARARGRSRTEEPFAEAADHEGTRNTLWRIGDADQIAALAGGARRGRAADRRRPPPLRDRARLRGGGRRRGRAPLRADVPVLADGPGAHRLPHPPAAHRPQGRPRQAGRDPRDADARLRGRGRSRATSSSRPASPTAASSSATWTASTSSRSC